MFICDMALIDVQQKEEGDENPTHECKLCSGNLIQMPNQLSTRFKEAILGNNAITLFRCEECGSEYSLNGIDSKL
jgi:uncharacterized protein with PIN domain